MALSCNDMSEECQIMNFFHLGPQCSDTLLRCNQTIQYQVIVQVISSGMARTCSQTFLQLRRQDLCVILFHVRTLHKAEGPTLPI